MDHTLDERRDESATSNMASHTLFRAAVESAPMAMLMIDGSGTIILANSEATRMFDYTREDLLGRPLEVLVPAGARDGHPRLRTDYFSDPQQRRMGAGRDLFAVRRDGSEFPVEIGLNPVETDDGLFVLSAIVDISERREFEQQRRLLEVMVEHVQDHAIHLVDLDGRVMTWNDGAARITGYQADEIIGKSIDCFLTTDDRARGVAIGMLQEAEACGQATCEAWRRRRDGSPFWAHETVTALRNPCGKLIGYSKITRDLTEQRLAHQRFQLAVESAPAAMLMINAEGEIVLSNREACRMFGYDVGALDGRPIEVLIPARARPGHPDLREGFFEEPTVRRMGAGRDLFGVRKDGTEFPVEIGLNPVETDEGLFVLSAVIDITERKQLEAERRQLQAELERRVAERTDELAAVNEALVQSNMELQQFAYIASHDLQTPLRGITGFARFLRQDYSDHLDDDGLDHVDRIIDGAARMQHLIQDLLAYSRVDSPSTSFDSVDLDSVIDDVVDLLADTIADLDAEITHDALPAVIGDRGQLTQLFENLIGNALKYRSNEAPRVQVSAERHDDVWRITVRDNGIGIDPEHHGEVFDIFRRLHTQRDYPGTGIGLAICQRIVQRHGGTIDIESEIGRGSSFVIELPDQAEQREGNPT